MKRLVAILAAVAALLIGVAVAAIDRTHPVDELEWVEVEAGESYWSIARDLDLSCTHTELWAANGRAPIDPGTILFIPPRCLDAPPVTTVPATTAAPTTVAPTTTPPTTAAPTTVAPTTPPTTVAPEPGDRPNSSTTGHDGNLTRTYSGGVTITQSWLDANNNGSRVIEDVRFNGRVNVRVDDLTIRNFHIDGGLYGVDNNVFSGNPTTGLVLEDGELTGQSSSGLLVSNTTARRLHIHHQGADAMKPFRNVLVEDCYVHHLGSNSGSHSDGVQMVNGGPVTVTGCNFDMPKDLTGWTNSQVFMIAPNNGPINDVSIRNNWINGGSISVQIHAVGGVAEVVDNRFGRDYRFGLFSTTGPVNISGNVWDDTGDPI